MKNLSKVEMCYGGEALHSIKICGIINYYGPFGTQSE